MSDLEVQETKVVDTLKMVLFGAFLVTFKSLVPVFFATTPKFVANTKICDCSGEASFGSFIEPAESLVIISFFVKEKTSKGIHRLKVAICG